MSNLPSYLQKLVVNIPLTKEDVVQWFRNSPASTRIDFISALLDSCLPFEIRFAGSIVEALGKKEYLTLRETTAKANSFMQSNATFDENKRTLFNYIYSRNEEPESNSASMPLRTSTVNSLNATTSIVNMTSNFTPATNSLQHSPHLSVTSSNAPSKTTNYNKQPLNNAQDIQLNRPSPSGRPEPNRPVLPYDPPQLRQQIRGRNHSPGSVTNISQPLVNGTSTGDRNCSPESDEKMDEDSMSSKGKESHALNDGYLRQKLIIYISLLDSNNHAAAAVYYSLLSQVEQSILDQSWLESLTDAEADEIFLLYTIGIHHPAFTFEQRLMLSEILGTIRSRRYINGKGFPAHCIQILVPVNAIAGIPPQNVHPVEHQPTAGPAGFVPSIPQPVMDNSRLSVFAPAGFYQHPPHHFHGYVTGPQNAIYVQQPLSSAIRPVSPNNIPPPIPVNEVPTGPKGEKVPPPLLEKIPKPIAIDPQVYTPSNKQYCFNCGEAGHFGHDCKQKTIEKMTARSYRVNFENNNHQNQ